MILAPPDSVPWTAESGPGAAIVCHLYILRIVIGFVAQTDHVVSRFLFCFSFLHIFYSVYQTRKEECDPRATVDYVRRQKYVLSTGSLLDFSRCVIIKK